jgi:multidrug resistance efflux pump
MSNGRSEDDVAEDKAEHDDDDKADAEANGDAEKGADGRTVKKGALGVVLAIVLSLTWYLLADRYTPYTRQARIEGYVVGVAPQVAGIVTKVLVTNNQEVHEGQPLFEIDPSQYQIALDKGEVRPRQCRQAGRRRQRSRQCGKGQTARGARR